MDWIKMPQVTVKSKDVTITASLLNAESITSQHTGAKLRQISIAVANEKIKILTEALEAKGVTEPALWDQLQIRLDAKLAGPLGELWRIDDLDKWPDDSSDAENETGAAATPE